MVLFYAVYEYSNNYSNITNDSAFIRGVLNHYNANYYHIFCEYLKTIHNNRPGYFDLIQSLVDIVKYYWCNIHGNTTPNLFMIENSGDLFINHSDLSNIFLP